MRQWIIQKGAFPQTTFLLVKAIKREKNESLKIRVPMMYLFKTTDVTYNYIHFFFNLSKLKKIVLFFSFLK